jgi:hypothetical protein
MSRRRLPPGSVVRSPLAEPGDAAALMRAALAPLARWCVANAVPYRDFDACVRDAFIAEALAAGADSASAVHLRTGLTRREITRQMAAGADTATPSSAASVPAAVHARWTGDPRFLDQRGEPRTLPRLRSQGGDVSFEALVDSVNANIRPRALLDLWLDQHIVRLDADDVVVPLFGWQVRSHSPASQSELLLRHGVPPLRAAVDAVLKRGRRWPNTAVYARALTPEQAGSVVAEIEPALQRVMRQLNTAVSAAEASTRGVASTASLVALTANFSVDVTPAGADARTRPSG